jgi:ankyrin repeat protein
MINYQGANCIHAAAATGNCDILKIFLEADYEYFELVELLGKNKLNKKRIAKHTFNKQECIDLMTTQLPSTALHLAIEKDHYDCAKLLLRNKAST